MRMSVLFFIVCPTESPLTPPFDSSLNSGFLPPEYDNTLTVQCQYGGGIFFCAASQIPAFGLVEPNAVETSAPGAAVPAHTDFVPQHKSL